MASIKPRKRGNTATGLQPLEADMQRAFSLKMGMLKRTNRDIHEDDPDSGVIYISHIPHGFYEPQMKKFFSQFGNIKRLRLSRSKKSGRSKGYAYVEFEFDEVAKVVAETMHNYLMYQKLLKCFYVPKEKLHPNTFKGCFRHFKNPRRREISAARNNGLLESGKEHILATQKRRVTALKKKQEKLSKLGIDFNIEGLESEWNRLKESQPPPAKAKVPRTRSAKNRQPVKARTPRKTAQKRPQQKKRGGMASKKVTPQSKELITDSCDARRTQSSPKSQKAKEFGQPVTPSKSDSVKKEEKVGNTRKPKQQGKKVVKSAKVSSRGKTSTEKAGKTKKR